MRLRVGKVELDRLKTNSDKALDKALFAVTENVLSDCVPYVPHLTGDLERSGDTKVENGHGYVMWGTTADTARYARPQYYGTGFSHDTPGNHANSPKACAKWFEAARAARKGSWEQMFKKTYEEMLHG